MSAQDSATDEGTAPENLAPTPQLPQTPNVAADLSSLSTSVNIETYHKVESQPLSDQDQSSSSRGSKLTGEANIAPESLLEPEYIKSPNKDLHDKWRSPSSPTITTAPTITHSQSLKSPLDTSGFFDSPLGSPLIDYGNHQIANISAKTIDDSYTEQQQPSPTPERTNSRATVVPQVTRDNSKPIKLTSLIPDSYPLADYEPDDILTESVKQEPYPSRKPPQQPQRNECDTDTCVSGTKQFGSLEFKDKDDNDDDDDDEITLATNETRFIPFEDDNHQLLTHDDPRHAGGPQRRHNVSFHLATSPQSNSLTRRLFNQIHHKLFGNSRTNDTIYTSSESEDLLSEKRKHRLFSRRRRTPGKTFRGGYRYSRSEISMGIMKKLFHMLFQRSTFALLGAFLIHVTLGTVYTLSNVNSYMTSYMRINGSPNATYGGAVWISSLCAVGQGFTMVLGGILEKRFSARVACFLGCALHSLSIASTSWSINYGPLAVLLTYGLLPGFGIGLAYMTPMTNGFGWFPNKRGLVAGVILAGFGIGTFVFNMIQTAFVNPNNLSPPSNGGGYFTQKEIMDRVPNLFVFMGSIYAIMQFVGCCLIFRPPNAYETMKDERPILVEQNLSVGEAVGRREFVILFIVYGIITQGVLFVNAMIKEYGQLFIGNDMYLAWVGSMSSIANASGRLIWGIAIDRFSFSQCFTAITIIFGTLMLLMPFEFILSSKLLYLLCTLGLFGSFSGWMSIFPVHVSRVFGRANSGVIYGLVFTAQSFGGIISAIGNHYLIDNFSRFVPFFCHVILDVIGLTIFHLFYPK